MATILLTWELGGGRGHLGPLRQLAERLTLRGHHVSLASRDVVAAFEIFDGLPVEIFAAPVLPARLSSHITQVRSYVDILHNIGFGSDKHLFALASAWAAIYRAVQPDVIVFDHSPTALAASYAFPVRRVLVGTGFACPPPGCETDDLRSWVTKAARQTSNARGVINNLNRLRKRQRLRDCESVLQLYADTDVTLLATFPELDHFPRRNSGVHLGVFPFPNGAASTAWPRGARRAFVYHKPHPHLTKIIKDLADQHVATIVFTGASDPATIRQLSSDHVRVAIEPLSLPDVMAQADFAILNGTHVTTVAALLAGKPSIHFPLVLEQWIFAERVKDLGAAHIVAANKSVPLAEYIRPTAIEKLAGAQSFAARYANFDPHLALATATETIEALAN